MGKHDPRVRELFGHLRQALKILEELLSRPAAAENPPPKVAAKSREDERPVAAASEKLALCVPKTLSEKTLSELMT
jgi:hypothetical protein